MNKTSKLLLIVFAFAAVFALLLVAEFFVARNEPSDGFRNPERAPVRLGKDGMKLIYVVMGDSTAAGRGADLDHGIAIETARHLALTHQVTFINLGVSGARINDVLIEQVPEAELLNADLILLSVGANDVTHLTDASSIDSGLKAVISRLLRKQPGLKIVVPGSANIGACPRLMEPLRCLAGMQTQRVNQEIKNTVRGFSTVTWVPLADLTSARFKSDQTLFAKDRFHPNNRGYTLWVEVLNQALDSSLLKQGSTSSH